jgi:NAD(P)-dependent dehydrogenase (short-subunit alcohol dehydrogenase family)
MLGQDFADKNILIVGASSGVGAALARQLGAMGANLYTVSRRQPEGFESHHLSLDLTEANFTLTHLPAKLHGIAYCAGSITLKPFQRLKREDLMKDYQINVLAAISVLQQSQAALKAAERSSVVLFGTVAAQTGMGFHASIATAKAALIGLTRSLAAEWASQGTRLNLIEPSLSDTPLAAALLSSPEKREAAAKRHPLGRIGTADDLAATAAFLLSEKAAWITGQTLGVDGGLGTLRLI